MTDIHWMSAVELVKAYKEKKLSPVEVVEALFKRIEAVNPKINALVTLLPEKASAAAKEAERKIMAGEEPGLLQGVPVTIKDNVFTAGVRTTFGSKIYERFIPDQDAVLVQRLKDSGAVVIGKTNLPEFGLIPVTDNILFGPTRNPWDLQKTPGGSSGGAAAGVATGVSPVATGNDGGAPSASPPASAAFTGSNLLSAGSPVIPSCPDGKR